MSFLMEAYELPVLQALEYLWYFSMGKFYE